MSNHASGRAVHTPFSVRSFATVGQELVGSLVTEIMQLPSLTSLSLSFNHFRGPLPMEYSSSSSRGRRLETLELQYNQLTGAIPIGFFASAESGPESGPSSLRLLNIGSNIFVGSIPSDVGRASNLQYLYIFENLLGGQLPLSIYNLPLVEFQAQGNFLKGNLLSLDSLSTSTSHGTTSISSTTTTYNGWERNLAVLRLSDNGLTGTLPRAFAKFSNLRDLALGGNNFGGPLRSSLISSQWSLLQRLDLSDNDMVGQIPSELALLPNLEILKLGLNQFSGAIPDSLCSTSTSSTISSLLPALVELEADCSLPLRRRLAADEDGPSNHQECLCCTTCCDRTTGICQAAAAAE
jgi:hypothetical protein